MCAEGPRGDRLVVSSSVQTLKLQNKTENAIHLCASMSDAEHTTLLDSTALHECYLTAFLCVLYRTIEIFLTTNKGVCGSHSFSISRRFNPHNPTRVWMENNPSSHTSSCRISTYFMCFVFASLHILFPTPWCNLLHLQPPFFFFSFCVWVDRYSLKRAGSPKTMTRGDVSNNSWGEEKRDVTGEDDFKTQRVRKRIVFFIFCRLLQLYPLRVWIDLCLAPVQSWWMV